jgi:hypothetical protein
MSLTWQRRRKQVKSGGRNFNVDGMLIERPQRPNLGSNEAAPPPSGENRHEVNPSRRFGRYGRTASKSCRMQATHHPKLR